MRTFARTQTSGPAQMMDGAARERDGQSPAVVGSGSGRSTVRIGPVNQFLADTCQDTNAYSATAPTISGQ